MGACQDTHSPGLSLQLDPPTVRLGAWHSHVYRGPGFSDLRGGGRLSAGRGGRGARAARGPLPAARASSRLLAAWR